MRFRAARELGILKFKCKIIPPNTPASILRAIVVKDNVAFGQDDLDILANEWDLSELREFGFDGLPSEEELPGVLDEKEEDKRKDFGDGEEADAKKDDDEIFAAHIADTMFPTDNEFGIPVLDVDRQPKTFPEAPIVAFGERRGWLTEGRTLRRFSSCIRAGKLSKSGARKIRSMRSTCKTYTTTSLRDKIRAFPISAQKPQNFRA